MPPPSTALRHLTRAASRQPLLTPLEEIELGRAIRLWQDWEGGPQEAPRQVQRRGKRALDRFVIGNLRLAHYVARRFRDRGVDMEDLVQAATEGLIKAYRRFQPALGNRSASYAIWYCQQACQELVAKQGKGLALPATISEKLRAVARARSRLYRELQRRPTEAELAEAVALKPEQLRNLLQAANRCDVRALDAPNRQAGRDADAIALLETIASDDQPEIALEREDARRALARWIDTCPRLTPQQRYLLRCRYLQLNPPTVIAIAASLNIKRDHARLLEYRALHILREEKPPGIEACLQAF